MSQDPNCTHVFEQPGFCRYEGTYVTCALCHQVVYAPEYAECVLCKIVVCVRCALFDPTEEMTEYASVWSEEDTLEMDELSFEDVTEEIAEESEDE